MNEEMKPTWRPIATAPKDRDLIVCVLGFKPRSARWMADIGWTAVFADDMPNRDAWDAYCKGITSGDSEWKPTHWQPMPLPPEPEAQGS